MSLGWWSWRFVCVVAVIAGHHFGHSEKAPNYSFLHEATSAPARATYDYIVIGGGTAGCAIAATLSGSATVLVLERGGAPYGSPNVENIGSFANNLLDFGKGTSPSQLFVSEDGVFNHRPRVLGGGSAINAGFYTRASDAYVAGTGWDPTLVGQAYQWAEEKVAFEPDVMQWQGAVKDALLEVGVGPDNGFTYNHLPGTKVGGTIFDRNGRRHTAADLLEYADPARITVLLHATVHKIVFDNTLGHARPRASGVIFEDVEGVMHEAFLNAGEANEIVLSAGAIGSPQVLMLSGIGPVDQLAAQSIQVILAQPMVGQKMADNPTNAVILLSLRPLEVSLIQTVGIQQSDDYYVETASTLSIGGIGALLAMAFDQVSLLPDSPTKTATIKAINRAYDVLNTTFPSVDLPGAIILEKISGPLSYGHLRLRNRDPNDTPAITFNYFQHPEDLRKCVEGMSTIKKIIGSEALSKFLLPDTTAEALFASMVALPVNLRPRRLSAAVSLEHFCEDTVVTLWHYHGGCRVGEVVDTEYRVMGVDALRVVDGSTFHVAPGTNPQATVMMLGRYVGEKMVKERRLA